MLHNEPSAFGSDYERAITLPESYFIDRTRNDPENFIIGAFADNELIGSCGGFRETDAKRRHIALVIGMYLRPEHRGTGQAARLLEAVLERLRDLEGVEQVQLAVSAGNQAAETLYRRAGFTPYGREPAALKVSGEYFDEILMSLPLQATPLK
jgi:RimJ/RimL family protein N-acetyltransferase